MELGDLARLSGDLAGAREYLDAVATNSEDAGEETLVEALIVWASVLTDQGFLSDAENRWQSVLSNPVATARQRSIATKSHVAPPPITRPCSIPPQTQHFSNSIGLYVRTQSIRNAEVAVERKRIPQIVVIVWITRKAMESLEATGLPWAHKRGNLYQSPTGTVVGWPGSHGIAAEFG